jgi:fumarate reductase (CoM/CoB) subunit A
MLDALRDQVNREGIPYIQEAMLARVLVTDNQVTGAIAYDYLNAKTILIKCPTVVIASGDASQIYYPHTMVSGESTGDGFSLAYEAGAQLVNMEQFEYMAFDYAYPDSARGKAVLENVAESGEMAYLRNSLGERFMERYNHQGKEWSTQEELAKAMWQEVAEGRGGPNGGVYLDLRHIPYDTIKRSAPERLEQMERLGYDVRTEMIEVYPAIHTTSGGIRIDPHCQTRVSGLFAAGQVASAVGDCLVEGGTGCVDALVWGKRAGEFSTKYSSEHQRIDPDEQQIAEIIHQLETPLAAQQGIPPIQIIRKLQRAMWEGASMIKDERGLEKALHEILYLRDVEFHQMCTRIKSGKFNIEMREAIEAYHMLKVSEMVLRSSLMRKESRNRFQRSDYADRDDSHWLQHIIVEKKLGAMQLTRTQVEFPYVAYSPKS